MAPGVLDAVEDLSMDQAKLENLELFALGVCATRCSCFPCVPDSLSLS